MYRNRIKLYITVALVLSVSSVLVFFLRESNISVKKEQKLIRKSDEAIVSTGNRIGLSENIIPRKKELDRIYGKKGTEKTNKKKVRLIVSRRKKTVYLDNNASRLRRLERVCNNNPGGFKTKSARKSYVHNTLISFNQSVIFCQIQKSGSSLWKKIIFNHYKPGTVNSLSNLKVTDEAYGNFFKFLFVRDPYERLFSGYVDKLFNPNVLYWGYVGRKAKALSGPVTEQTQCGHDTTFSEFIKYIISVENKPIMRDRHFFSMYEHCEPCNHKKIDYIGKIETLNRDADAIFEAIKMDNKTISKYKNMMVNSSLHDIESMATRLFSYKPGILKCMTMYEAVLRVWRNLQIKGIIGRNIIFPFTPSNVLKIRKEQFIKKIRQYHILSQIDKTLRFNKDDAFLEAYASVSYQDLMKLKDIVEKDCLLFGYDSKPNRVFNAKLLMKSKFRFFRV